MRVCLGTSQVPDGEERLLPVVGLPEGGAMGRAWEHAEAQRSWEGTGNWADALWGGGGWDRDGRSRRVGVKIDGVFVYARAREVPVNNI